MLRVIGLIAVVYVVLSLVSGGTAFQGPMPVLMWDNPLAEAAGLLLAVVVCLGLLALFASTLLVMVAGLPLLIIAVIIGVILLPALLPFAILLALGALVFGGLGCLFA
ncbi:MAG: hypothetical protein AAF552_06670 [Pseudomonadota bacterium]